jgi:hypothetical protein
MRFFLWHPPYNGASFWFDRANLRRCQVGWRHENWSLWWAIFGFSGGFKIQSWPWQRNPSKRSAA